MTPCNGRRRRLSRSHQRRPIGHEWCASVSERHVEMDSLRAPLSGSTIPVPKSRNGGITVSDTAVEAGLDKQNGVTLGRILGRGTVGHAEEGPDGKMQDRKRRRLDSD